MAASLPSDYKAPLLRRLLQWEIARRAGGHEAECAEAQILSQRVPGLLQRCGEHSYVLVDHIDDIVLPPQLQTQHLEQFAGLRTPDAQLVEVWDKLLVVLMW